MLKIKSRVDTQFRRKNIVRDNHDEEMSLQLPVFLLIYSDFYFAIGVKNMTAI